MKVDYVDAVVTEYVSRDNYIELSGAMSRRRFENVTGMTNIPLNHEIGYWNGRCNRIGRDA